MTHARFVTVSCVMALLAGCSSAPKKEVQSTKKEEPAPSYFKVDPATAGVLKGTVKFTGKKPARKAIDMDQDPACVATHKGSTWDESVLVNSNGTLANVFVYIKGGLEGKTFAVPATPVALDQRSCWFHPRVLGIQTGQTMTISNSDPVMHNIHPQPEFNREWNHSQGEGEAPLERRFLRPEVMIKVKCNVHSWMRAFIGVVDHPYFAVTGADGSFEMPNVPPGDYVVEAWQEKLGTQEQKITVAPSGQVAVAFTFKGE